MSLALRFEHRPGIEYPKDTWMTWTPDGTDLLGENGVLRMHDRRDDVIGSWLHTRAEAIEEAFKCGYQPLVTSSTSHSVPQITRKGGVCREQSSGSTHRRRKPTTTRR